MSNINILGIVGSLRKDSYNHAALTAAQELAPEGVALNLVELHGIPIFNQSHNTAPPAAVMEFRRQILEADAILFATLDYNFSLAGGLRNAIEWGARLDCANAWLGKPAAVMGASAGSLGKTHAQYQLRQMLATLNMPVVDQVEVITGHAAPHVDPAGRLTDAPTRQRIQILLTALLQLVSNHQASPGHAARYGMREKLPVQQPMWNAETARIPTAPPIPSLQSTIL